MLLRELGNKRLADFNKKKGTISFYCPNCGIWLKTVWPNHGMVCRCSICKKAIRTPSSLDINKFHRRIRQQCQSIVGRKSVPNLATCCIGAFILLCGTVICLLQPKPAVSLPIVKQVCQLPTAKAMPAKVMPIVVRQPIDGHEQAEKWAEVKSAIMQIVAPPPQPIVEQPQPIIEQPTRQVEVAASSYEPPAPPVVSSESVKVKSYPKYTQPTGTMTRQLVAKETRQPQKARSQPVHSHAVVIRGAFYWPPMPYIPRLTNRKG